MNSRRQGKAKPTGHRFQLLATWGVAVGFGLLSSAKAAEPSLPLAPYEPALTRPAIGTNDIAICILRDDFERLTGATRGHQLTASRPFTETDIGKVVVVKKGRVYMDYKLAPIAWNGYISAVAEGVATLSSSLNGAAYGDPETQLVNVARQEILVGSNNFDDIQAAIDSAIAAKKKLLKLQRSAPCKQAYVVPSLSAVCRAQQTNYKGLTVNGNLILTTTDADVTIPILKFGTEELAGIDGWQKDYFHYNGLNYGGLVELWDMQMEGADIVSTKSQVYVTGFHAVNTGPRGLVLRNFKLLSPNLKYGWYSGIEEVNTEGAGRGVGNEKLKIVLQDAEIQAGCPVTIFSQNGAVKRYVVRNGRIRGGAKPTWKGPFSATRLVTKDGFTYLTVENDEFSFCDATSYDPYWNTQPYLQLYPPSEGDAVVEYWPADTHGLDKYSHGKMVVHSPPAVNLADGTSHGVRLVPAKGFDTSAIDFQASAWHAESGQPMLTTDNPNSTPGTIKCLIDMNHPILVQSDGRKIDMPLYIGVYARSPSNRNNAKVGVAPLNKQDEIAGPLSPKVVAMLDHGSVFVRGRANYFGEGHSHYIHPNVELDIDGIHITDQIRLGLRNGSDNGQSGTHNLVQILHWTQVDTYLPFAVPNAYFPAAIQLHAENFKGTAVLSAHIGKPPLKYDIVVPAIYVDDSVKAKAVP